MPNIRIFQIYYSAATRAQLDPGFEPLDNLRNERPDWREYWPIRRQLRDHPPVDEDYYGFLSPHFHRKTRLSATAVQEFVRASAAQAADVVLFSPFFDQSAFFINPWEQGAAIHQVAAPALSQCLELVAPGFGIQSTVCSSRETVFCNYFVARGAFWREWLARCERLFQCAEAGSNGLGQLLASQVDYLEGGAPLKVFMIERIATALLATQTHWRTKAYNPMSLPFSQSEISPRVVELAALDALKIAYQTEAREQYRHAFLSMRARLLADLKRVDGQRA